MTVGFDGQILVWDSKQESKSRDLVQETPFLPVSEDPKFVANSEGEEMGLMNICFDADVTSRCFWSTTVFLLRFKRGRKKAIWSKSICPPRSLITTTMNESRYITPRKSNNFKHNKIEDIDHQLSWNEALSSQNSCSRSTTTTSQSGRKRLKSRYSILPMLPMR